MRHRWAAVLFALVLAIPAPVSVAAADKGESMDMYTATVDGAGLAELVARGYDLTDLQAAAGGDTTVTIVLTNRQRADLAKAGIHTKVIRDAKGRSSRERAAAQAAAGYTVWRSWDEPGGIRDQMYDFAKKNAGFAKLVVLGRTHQGREILAIKMTQGAKGQKDGSRPAVLYMSNQHAREWISVEVNRRLMNWFMDQRKAANPEIIALLQTTELWFILSANPDGYQYTFDHSRLWRKNLRDNNGNGTIEIGDGVDPNRNFNAHWNYDNEGSSSLPSSDTYRGPSAESEPETQASAGLMRAIRPKLVVNFHSYGPLILTPQGWQVGTPDADNPIYTALAGVDANPGIPGFDPGNSADELYVTNGETTDFADGLGALAFTPELRQGCPGCGFVFPDDEALVQAEFENTLAFDLDIAKSATHPATPSSHLGNTVKPFYLSQTEVDAENGALSMFDFSFDKSYGDPQEVRILAKRSLGAVSLKFQVNGGAVQTRTTSAWTGGEKYGQGTGTYYHVVGGTISGTNPGDSVKVWFEGGGATSDSFTYQAVSETGRRVLILSAEDYTGASGQAGAGPFFLSYYQAALTANGIASDVYDVDANGRVSPDALGILSHYDAVVWYTGNDIITREPGWGGGNASRLAMQELLSVRDYLNEGGRVLYTGKFAGHQYALGHGNQRYDPFLNEQCALASVTARCRTLSGSGDGINDVVEYWLGASLINEDAGFNGATGNLFNVVGVADPFLGTNVGFNGPDSAQNQDHSASFIATSGLLPASEYPQFRSQAVARYDRPGGAFDPHTGDYYIYSNISDVSYKRLTRTITVPGGGATMSFWISRDTEPDWDFVFVEAHTPGQNNWTTLADMNGHTGTSPGQSCTSGWNTLHPFIDHYQTLNANGTCSSTGTTGSWNAASGASGTWQQWQVDLGAFAGGQVELSITYTSDWATQNLGVFIDDIVVSTGEGSTSFEAGLDGWTVPGAPAGSAANFNDWTRTTAGGFPEGATVSTPDSLYMGFGMEGITGAADRALIMARAMAYLLN